MPTRSEQYVAEAWSVSVDRFQHQDAYPALLKALRLALAHVYQRMEQTRPTYGPTDCGSSSRPATQDGEAINDALGLLPEGTNTWWSWNSVRPRLGLLSRVCVLARILIRPSFPHG